MNAQEYKEKRIKEALRFHGINRWHELEYKGQGFNFLELEHQDNKHGQRVVKVFNLVAPKANTYLGGFGYRIQGDKVITCTVKYNGEYIDLKKFIKDKNIHLVGASMSSAGGRGFPEPLIRYLKDIPVIYGGAAGNKGFKGVTGWFEYLGIMVGEIRLRPWGVVRDSSSGVEDTLDFVALPFGETGTSFSFPALFGIIAIIFSKYGFMSQEDIYIALKSICLNLGKKERFGHGAPILPYSGKIKKLEEDNVDNKLYTIDEIIKKLNKYNKKELHIHHTWKPDLTDFNGSNHVALQNGMRDYHMNVRGFQDIAQHITQFPDGKFMIGRDFSWIPASSLGKREDGKPWNNSSVFMIENIGNFDTEEIPQIMWENNIKLAAYFIDNGGTYYFHRQMDNKKSCPGKKFDYVKFVKNVKERFHWAEKHFQNLNKKGITVHERRFEDNMKRGEIMALVDRITDK